MCELLHEFEDGKVEVPDYRVVIYFSANPDCGGHMFYPDRIFDYIRYT
jgi:hypothetical protein